MTSLKNFRRFFNKALRQPAYALKVLLKRSIAYQCYLFGRGKSAAPEAITLFLTHRCNLACKMCGQWGDHGVTRRQGGTYAAEQMPWDLCKKIIDEVSAFKPNLTLFGGEPLLHSDCLKLIRYIKEKKMHCLMITNGYLLDNYAQEIVGSGLDELNVSLDGPGPLHDSIRGLPGLFERIMQGLAKINSLKKESGLKKPLINLQCTINQDNYSRLEQMLEVAVQAGADSLTFHNLIFISKEIIERQKKSDLELSAGSADWEGFISQPGIDSEVLYQKMLDINLKKKGAGINIDFYPNFSGPELSRYYRDPDFSPVEYPLRCLSPWIVAYVFPDGLVKPCLNSSYSFGDLKSSEFSRVWNSLEAVKYRRLLKAKKIFPACVRCTELYRY